MRIPTMINPLRPELRISYTPALVRELESVLELKLPSDYLAFLAKYGGSLLGDDLHYITAPILVPCPLGNYVNFEVIYGFYSDPSDLYDLREVVRAYRERIPPNVVPIGSTIGEDLVLLSCSGSDQGNVYLWDQECSYLKNFENLREVFQELEDAGVSEQSVNLHEAVMAWEGRHREALSRPPGYGPLYLLANSFPAFLDALVPTLYEPEDLPMKVSAAEENEAKA